MARSAGTFVEWIDLENLYLCNLKKYALILKCKHLEFLMQVLNVDGMKFGNTKLILPVTNLVPRQYYCYVYGMLYISRSCLFDCYTLSCVAVCFYWTKLYYSHRFS